MNIEFSDIVSQDFIPVVAVLLTITAAIWLYGRKHNMTAQDNSIHFILMVAGVGLSALSLGIGVYNNAVARPYFERFHAFYENAAGQRDFWINPTLQELASQGTINNTEFNDTVLASNNEAIQLLRRHFPSDDFNVSNLDKLRTTQRAIRACVPDHEKGHYLRRVSELPVPRHTFGELLGAKASELRRST